MQYRKLAAVAGSALMAGLSLAAPVLATSVTKLSDISTMASVTGTTPNFPVFVIGANAATSDVAGAVDVAVNLASNVKTSTTISVDGAAPGVTGGIALDSVDTKMYLTDYTNKAKSILTSTDLPTFLTAGTVEDEASTKYDYSQYLNIGQKQIQFAQPDVSAGIKDPAYLVKLGTSVNNDSPSNYLVQGWVSFTKQFNASNAIGKEMTLFGKTFTISSETDSTQLVLFGLAGKETVTAGESKTISIGSTSYNVEVVGISSTNAILSVNGVQKTVVAGKTYDFSGTSVYVSDVFYYEVPAKSGSVVMSIGSDRYVFKDGQRIQKGTSGNEDDVDGTKVSFTGSPVALSGLKVSIDAYTATPNVDYIKAGSTWTDPIFGIKVSYNGPAAANTQDITISPGGTSYFTVAFTDKYDKSATVSWAYDASPSTAGNEVLADSNNEPIHVVENAAAGLNDYVFVSAGNFPHMLRITNLETSVASQKVTYRDVFSGTEYKVTNSTTNAGTAVIDGQSYTVTFAPGSAAIKDADDTKTVLFPTLETKYGAKVAFVAPATVTNNTAYTLPTGTSTLICGESEASTTVGGISYNTTTSGENCIVELTSTANPSLLVIEEESKAGEKNVATYTVGTDESDDRLELSTPAFTNNATNSFLSVSTSSTDVTNTVTEWGTKIVYDKSAAGVATITYPDTQVVHAVAVGENPVWSTGAAGGSTTTDVVIPITADVVKLDSEVTSSDMSNYDMVLVGGPCINSLVAQLAADGDFPYTCETWPGRDFGRVQVIADAFATGKTALVIAGTTAAETDLAARVVQTGFNGATDAQKASAALEITGSVSSPAYSQ